MELQTITIKEYLTKKGIDFRESNGEIITKCLFSGCDDDSGGNEMHLYFNSETGQYDCKKCGEKGNLITLAKHLGDSIGEISLGKNIPTPKKTTKIKPSLIEDCHKALPDRIRQYLNGRGITDDIISEYKLGWGEFYGKWWITIPIQDNEGKYQFLKLRKDPDDQSNDAKYVFYPAGSEADIYGWESIQGNKSSLVICEGELDRLILIKNAIPAITSTAGAGTFKKEWLEHLKDFDSIYVAFDKDEAGKREAEKLVGVLGENLPDTSIYQITLPEEMTDGKDVSDYFNRYDGNPDKFFYGLSQWVAGREPIDVSKFVPLNSQNLSETLRLTIKQDEENKIATFLCQLSAYTDNAQFNISFNAPSSTGKSYIPTEIARLFPAKDVMELAHCSPMAFFHDIGRYNNELKGYIVDLSRKIIIFLDQPHNELLARLRPILSHDKKEILSKITDKSQKHGLRTKSVLIKGFPSVIFCTAGLKIDEQEATRFLLLSPEINQDKIRQGVLQTVRKEADSELFENQLEQNPERALLKERIRAIRNEHITSVKISNEARIIEQFFSDKKSLKPRHQRDIKRLISLVKSFALLNLWWRDRDGSVITANEEDMSEAFKIWDEISVSQELNLPPYIYNLYNEVILKLWQEKNGNRKEEFIEVTGKVGVTRQDILDKHYKVYGRMLDTFQLRQQIIPMLETAGLITQETDPTDKRKTLIFPTVQPAFTEGKDIVSSIGG
jgi:DNA primase